MPTLKYPTLGLLKCDAPGSLVLATRRLIRADKRSHHQLALDLGVPFYWLKSFIHGVADSPSVNRVQYIYEKLSGSKLL